MVFAIDGFLAVGAAGTILTTSDGESWSEETSPTDVDLLAVGWGDGVFVAVGKGGTILSSTDGVSWDEQDSTSGRDLFGVTYGDGLFVVVGKEATSLPGESNLDLASIERTGWFAAPRGQPCNAKRKDESQVVIR